MLLFVTFITIVFWIGTYIILEFFNRLFVTVDGSSFGFLMTTYIMLSSALISRYLKVTI